MTLLFYTKKNFRVRAQRRLLSLKNSFLRLPQTLLGYCLLPAAFLLILGLRPFLLIRIQPMITWRLGHFAANIEMYLCERDAGLNIPSRRYLDIWYFWTVPCNFQLASMWQRIICVGPAWLLAPLHSLLSRYSIFHIHLIVTTDRDIHCLLDSTLPHLQFTGMELEIGSARLREIGVPHGSPFVCLNVRDKLYLDRQAEHFGANVDWSYHNYRDCDVQNYVKAAEELTRRGYYVIRMGVIVNEPMNTVNPMVIDYAGSGMRSDFMDIFLGAHCAFCISNNTGFDTIPYVFRRPILYVDAAPFGIINTFSARFMSTTKEHWLKSENRQLSLEEILGSDAMWYLKTQEFEMADIQLKESSPDDILQAVVEMEERLSGVWSSTEGDEKLQAYFWSLFPRNKLHGEIRSRVGAHFLRTRLAWKSTE